MPNALLIEGDTYPIRTDFRAGIEYQTVAAAGKLTAANLYEIWFVDRYPQNVNEAQEGINRFYRREDATKGAHSKGPIPYDFTVDADVIVSGFLQKYGIDLTDPELEMHWWRFMALLEGLAGSNFAWRVDVRTRDLSGMKSKERARWMKMRSEYAIEKKSETVADHMAMLDQIIARHGGETHG